MITVKTVSSLDKVFACEGPNIEELSGMMLKNERFAFQICFHNSEGRSYSAGEIKVEGDLEKHCTLRIVEHIAGQYTKTPDSDDYVLKKDNESSGLYPELLRPIREDGVCLRGCQWTSVWCSIYCKKGLPVGTHTIKVKLSLPDYKEEVCAVYTLNVIDAKLPESDLIYTDWVHYDGIAHYYQEEPFTSRYYELLAPFIDSAVAHGMNMLFTPLFTPPLDTAVGTERMETQLVGVTYSDGKYSFSFEKLDYFIRFALGRGIKYIEFSHLATQWGSEYCPKIMAKTNNGYERIFGWDTPSTEEEYKRFLTVFLPALCDFIEKNGWADICYFHVSDEPPEERRQTFVEVSNFIKKLLKNYRILDATADPNSKQLDIPVISVSRYTEDMDKRCWVYYSNGAYKNYVPNRYFNMPSLRNRILGMQLYLNDVKGFLHWGFNFYKTTLSRRYVDPYSETDGNGGFQSGDAFIVYPTENGVLDSLRHEVFYDGLQDRMLLRLLEGKIGREAVVKILKDAGMKGFSVYPHREQWFNDLRAKLLNLVQKYYT